MRLPFLLFTFPRRQEIWPNAFEKAVRLFPSLPAAGKKRTDSHRSTFSLWLLKQQTAPGRTAENVLLAYSLPALFSRWQQFFTFLHSGFIAAQTWMSPPEMVILFPFTKASAICCRACSYILATVDLEILIFSAHCF